MGYELTLITGPASEPITLEQARLHLRLDADGSPETHPDDDIVTDLIQTAREKFDGKDGLLGRCLITQTWELVMDQFPWHEIRIPLPPLQSVESVKYLDLEGDLQTIASSNYEVSTTKRYGRIRPVPTFDWPATIDRYDAVKIRFVAGYGNAAVVPMRLKQAMFLMIGHWYAQREAVTIGINGAELPMGVDALIADYRVMGFGG